MTKRYELSELIRSDNFIDGKWVASAKGKRFDVTDPATGEVITQVADSDAADARAATDAAARAFPAWRDALPKDRAAVLHRWHALMVENADALGRLISLEQGKPFAEGRGEVMYGASYVARSLTVGPIRLADFPVSINQAPMSASLLGMTFFRRLETFQIKGNQLLLSWRG